MIKVTLNGGANMSEKETVLYHKENGIARLDFNRPETLNAINQDVMQRLAVLLDIAKADEALKAVIITAVGEKAFCAGDDIKFLSQASPLEVRELARTAVSVNNKIETLGKVVVAAINGYALGGGLELAGGWMLRLAIVEARL